jgi:hypothetical protein
MSLNQSERSKRAGYQTGLDLGATFAARGDTVVRNQEMLDSLAQSKVTEFEVYEGDAGAWKRGFKKGVTDAFTNRIPPK